MSTLQNAEYLGDAVYVGWSAEGLTLATGSHDLDFADQVIFIDAEVLGKFIAYVRKLRVD